MTKRREPFSAEDALYRIANFIGWDVAARIAGREERTIRQWSEPDEDRHCPAAIAVRLDIAWRDAGGVGLPFHDAHRHHLEAATPPPVEVVDLQAQYRVVRRETYEADDAVIEALTRNNPAACIVASREIEESIAAKWTMHSLLIAASMTASMACSL